jgi:hypothetical protein
VKGNLIWMETSLPAHSYWMIEKNTIFLDVFTGRALWVGVGLGFVP